MKRAKSTTPPFKDVTFGEELRTVRDDVLDWTQHRLANQINEHTSISVTEENIRNWENNRQLAEITPEILSAIASTLHRGLATKGLNVGSEKQFQANLETLLNSTITQIEAGEEIDQPESFGGKLAAFRQMAGFKDRSSLISVIKPNYTYTGRDIAEAEQGNYLPTYNFLRDLSKVPDLSPHMSRLNEAYTGESIGKRRIQPENSEPREQHEVPANVREAIELVNLQRRKLASHFLEGGKQEDEPLTDAERTIITSKLAREKEGFPGVYFALSRSMFTEPPIEVFGQIDPWWGVSSNQSKEFQNAYNGFIAVSLKVADRLLAELPKESGERARLETELRDYNEFAKTARDSLKNWQKQLHAAEQRSEATARG